MDFQHRPGGKTGSGGVASSSESNRDRRERLRQLALETIDINKVCTHLPTLKQQLSALQTSVSLGLGLAHLLLSSARIQLVLQHKEPCPGWGDGGSAVHLQFCLFLDPRLPPMWGWGLPGDPSLGLAAEAGSQPQPQPCAVDPVGSPGWWCWLGAPACPPSLSISPTA